MEVGQLPPVEMAIIVLNARLGTAGMGEMRAPKVDVEEEFNRTMRSSSCTILLQTLGSEAMAVKQPQIQGMAEPVQAAANLHKKEVWVALVEVQSQLVAHRGADLKGKMGVKASRNGIQSVMVGMVGMGAHLAMAGKEALGGARPRNVAGMGTLDRMGIFVNSQHPS
jgi:hypothetical protein